MSFDFIKQLEEHKEDQMFIAESIFGMGHLLSEDKEVLSENIKQFIVWARNLLARPIVNKNQIERDPTVDAGEALPFDVKDEKDAFAKLAKTIAGLTYFMNNKVKDDSKDMIAAKVQGDKEIDAYVKKFGVNKAMEIVKKVGEDLKTKDRSGIKAMIDKIEKFYGYNAIKA